MSLQAIAFEKEDFDLFNGVLSIATHVMDCPNCRDHEAGGDDERQLFELVNERVMVPIDVGDYGALAMAAAKWMQIYLCISGERPN